jgi:hypothetical protein
MPSAAPSNQALASVIERSPPASPLGGATPESSPLAPIAKANAFNANTASHLLRLLLIVVLSYMTLILL